MPLIVSNNIISLNTRRKLTRSQSSPANSMHRLAVGLRVHSPGNDTITPMAAQATIGNVAGTVNAEPAALAASQSHLEAVTSTPHLSIEHQSAANSRIIDTNLAAETTNLGRANIWQPAGSATVAQADPLPQQVRQLLR